LHSVMLYQLPDSTHQVQSLWLRIDASAQLFCELSMNFIFHLDSNDNPECAGTGRGEQKDESVILPECMPRRPAPEEFDRPLTRPEHAERQRRLSLEPEEMQWLVLRVQFVLGQVVGWSISETQGTKGLGLNVIIGANPSTSTRNAALALVSALNELGLTDENRRQLVTKEAQQGSLLENTPPDLILLYVGAHP
jgi:hypothetical protein